MMTVSDLFGLSYGHSLELNRLARSDALNAVNFVSRTARNNGVSASVAPLPDLEPAQAGTISVALNGQGGAGTAFLQPAPYYTAYHVMVLTPKTAMSELERLWWAHCITANRFRFGFGRQANKSLATLRLPEKVPLWVSAINLEPFEGARAPYSDASPPLLTPSVWAEFRYEGLFEIKKGLRLTKADMTVGDTPFIGSIDSNNGRRQLVATKPNHDGNTITVNYNGSVAEAFYQPSPFWASDDVNVLYPKFPLNQYVGMFLCALIRQEKFRFNYGRKWHLERMNEAVIRLPVTSANDPDWNFMEGYIKSLPYSKSI
jgi:hypothetical protein